MNDHSLDSTGQFDEPEGGWETAPRLFDTELLVTTLCRFTGFPREHSGRCLEREAGQHPDEECAALYVQAGALRDGRLDLAAFGEDIPEEVRVPFAGDAEPSGGPH
jgi:hypothetical protein